MFMVSVKASKQKLALFLVAMVGVFALAGIIDRFSAPAENGASDVQAREVSVSVKGSNENERLSYLKAYGWDVDKTALETAQIVIPEEFDEILETYNALQKLQGFDLSKYRGRTVERYTYRVTNYPGYGADSEAIHAVLLVSDGAIIGGDIESVELDGFMHGFDMETPETVGHVY